LSPLDDETRTCHILATTALGPLLEVIVALAGPFSGANHAVDNTILPPFITYLIYKGAAILTERLRTGDESSENIQRLKSLRYALRSVSNRWLGAGK
jgi:hypothetical protein